MTRLDDRLRFIALMAAGIACLCLRDPHSLLVPTLYTEDGAWMAKLFNKGFWHTLIHAKGGETPYFVVLNILLLQAAKSLNAACFGDSLAHLPRFVSALSMVFYALLAAAPVWLLRRGLAAPARGLLWGLVIFMPLGESSFEILGRVSNIGYAMLFACVCLLAWRRTADRGRPWAIAMADVGTFVGATTNPLCIPVIVADVAARGWRAWRSGLAPLVLVRRSVASRSSLILAVAVTVAVFGMTMLESRPNRFLRDGLVPRELIEATIARPLLYPVVFPWYGRLDDGRAMAAVGILAGLLWWLTANASRERPLLLGAITAAIYAATVTVVTRPGLTGLLDKYRSTGLDRYYFGTSLLVMLAVAAGVSAGLRSATVARRRVAACLCAAMVAIYAAHPHRLVEFGRTRWHDPPSRSFAVAVATAAADLDGQPAGDVAVQLHPPAWRARFPATHVRATALAFASDGLRR